MAKREPKVDYSGSPIPKPGKKVREPRKEARARKRLSPVNRERRDWLRVDQYGEAAVIVRAMHCVGCHPRLYKEPENVMHEVASAFSQVQATIGMGLATPERSDPHHVHHRSDSDAASLVPCCRICHQEADEHRPAFEAKHAVDLDRIARWIAGPVALLLNDPDPVPADDGEDPCAV